MTVRRATTRPCWASWRVITASDSGDAGRSVSMMSLISPRIAVPEQALPLALTIAREKKYFSSNTPIGVEMYLLLVTRETVDS